ncbi:MAG: glycoside hydrolase family 3 C-terminal domain-containing protein [Burkholderiales bacterium]|nr:glycoside hydrolase family 3 C-terminal domain-containing protein [Burkholderiales bacterium]
MQILCSPTLRGLGVIVMVVMGCAGGMPAYARSAEVTTSRALAPAEIEARVQQLVAAMSLEQKIGQMTQAEIGAASPSDVAKYALGAVLNGGGSRPHGDKYARAQDWVKLADAYYESAPTVMVGAVPVKLRPLWGSDAVHGNNSVYGATIFPHNIGLGAARSSKLAAEVAAATARAVRATGVQWAFAPTLAVAQDVRWGRTYESFSADPAVVADYADAIVRAMQGDLVGDTNVIATAKHFIGDGGTQDGVDLGVTTATLAELEAVHGQGFRRALKANVQTVMASLHHWIDHGTGVDHGRVHGDRTLLTDVLKTQWGFDGFIVSDWNGIGHVAGCNNASCAAAINAGIDMVMVPHQWRDFIRNTVAQVQRGEIPLARIDDAVSRILRVKLRAGVIDRRPSTSSVAGDESALQARELARRAVRESLVLLKNNQQTLPLSRGKRVLVVGKGADNFEMQTGGWTLSWQGTGNSNSDFPTGQTIFAGLREALGAQQVVLAESAEGIDVKRFDAVVAVLGETPYAEVNGDLPPSDTLRHSSRYPEDLAVLQRVAGRGVPVVTVLLSGRPLYVNDLLNRSDAFVAAWLPGTEGGGIADVLVHDDHDGRRPGIDFRGRLPFSWPTMTCPPAKVPHPAVKSDRFGLGGGMSYREPKALPIMEEDTRTGGCAAESELTIFDQHAQRPYGVQLSVAAQQWQTHYVSNDAGTVAQAPVAQPAIRYESVSTGEGRRAAKVTWLGAARLTFASRSRAALSNFPDASLLLEYSVQMAPRSAVKVEMECGPLCRAELDVTQAISTAASGSRTLNVPLACFAARGANLRRVEVPFALRTQDSFAITITGVRVVAHAATQPGALRCEPTVPAATDR